MTKNLKSQGSSLAPPLGPSAPKDWGLDQGSVVTDFSRHFGRVSGIQRSDRKTLGLTWITLTEYWQMVCQPIFHMGEGEMKL